ncbi:MAG TPA: N-6 DNA methylase [Terracidiphilus sp.]|jgi:hypothetical protein|nr:N-6 DNA methylase [Terracidiphilus sp.]
MTTGATPLPPDDLEALVLSEAKAISEKIAQNVQSAGSEEDVRHTCNKLIDDFIEKAGLDISGRHEYEINGGFLDSKYSRVLLEYKFPHNKSSRIDDSLEATGTKKVVEQLQSRFLAFKKKENRPYETLLGVGLDGIKILFVRRHGEDWDIAAPKPITPYTIEKLLRALISLGAQGHSYTASQLAAHFGSESFLAQKAVRQLYSVLIGTTDKKTKVFFAQWKILFGEVCGYSLDNNNEHFKKLAKQYQMESAKPAELFFCIHTFYAAFMKFLAAQIATSFGGIGTSVLKKCVGAPSSNKLRHEMKQLERGGIWADVGIKNFLEGDLFAWYLTAWNDDVAEVIKSVVQKLDEYDPRTLSVDVFESRDLLKHLYQHLFPKAVRHDLGEYYTPDWLAEQVLDAVGYDGNPDSRILDPACGSGTFLVLAMNRIKKWFAQHRESCGFDEAGLAAKIASNVVGFDLNPLAVMAARTNFLLAFRDLLKYVGELEIPIYLCDSILVPTEYGDLFTKMEHGKLKRLPTSVGDFLIPKEISFSRDAVAKYAAALSYCVQNKTSAQFLQYCVDEGLPITEVEAHTTLFEKLQSLDKSGENGIWALIIKNSFAPLFTAPMDFVVGNPPWVNWESLPEGYRKDTQDAWTHYKLTGDTATGRRQASDKSKTDVAFLMTYVATDVYLKGGGKLGFVITQTGFQSELGGRAFRKFSLPDDSPLGIVGVEDMVGLRPFGAEAANRTSVLLIQKGQPLKWPLPYRVWERTGKVDLGSSLEQVIANTKVLDWVGYPIQKADPLSSWIVGKPKPVAIARKFVGPSHYHRAVREGVNTRGANGIFYVERLEEAGHKYSLVRNLPPMGRKKQLTQETGKVDNELIYPLLTGKDVHRWIASPKLEMLLPHSPAQPTNPIPESSLLKYNKPTLLYLRKFETNLRGRRKFRNFNPSSGDYYGLYNVGTYSFCPFKVVWREIASDFMVSPVFTKSGLDGVEKVIIPNHKLMIIPVGSKKEALFVAGMLNSTIARYTVLSYTITTQISTHVLNNIKVPQFDPGDTAHKAVVDVAKRCVKAASDGESVTLSGLDVELDEAARSIWGASSGEMSVLREALGEIREALSQAKSESEEDAEDDD